MGVGTNLQRYFLITLNTVFIFFSAGLFAAALWSEFFYRDYFDVVDGQPVLVFLFASSCFIFLISLFGWAGSYKQHIGLLKFYLSLCIVVFAAQLLLSIFSLLYSNEILPYFVSAMYGAISVLAPPIQKGFDLIQTDLHCCGVENSTDWVQSQIWLNSTLQIIEENNLTSPNIDQLVPDSCCKNQTEFCGIVNNEVDDIYQTGCAVALKEDLEENINLFAILLAIICALQLTSILFAGCLVNNQESEDEVPLLQNQESPNNQVPQPSENDFQ